MSLEMNNRPADRSFFSHKKEIGPGTVAQPVIPAPWEAKVGGSLEIRSSKPAWHMAAE